MSTTIITNQAAVKFSTSDIVYDLQTNAKNQQIERLLETLYEGSYLFNSWQTGYVFLIEEYIESNVSPQIPKWSAFLPVLPENDIVCGYIDGALTSFEGGMIKFKGSGRTSPETALRKLRNTLKDAPSFNDYLRFNPRGFDFQFDMHEDTDKLAKAIIGKLGFDLTQQCFNQKTLKSDVGFIRFNIDVRTVSDIIKVIMVTSISKQTVKVSRPRYQSSILNKVSNAALTKAAT